MKAIRSRILAVLLGLSLVGASGVSAQGQVLSGLFGAGAGTAAGGYITLSLVVARAQAGHYLHDFHDVFAWGSLTVIAGGSTGLALGVIAPERMWTGFIYGSAGTVTGGTLGFLAGATLSDRPEAKWAYAAIAAGAGMALGSLIGAAMPNEQLVDDLVPRFMRQTSKVPLGFTVKF